MTNLAKKRKGTRMDKLRIDEVSVVDRACQEPATIAIMKRAPAVEKRRAVTTVVDEHAHVLLMSTIDAELTSGTTSWTDDHAHDWIADEAGNVTIVTANGHTHDLSVFVSKAGDEPLSQADIKAAIDTLEPESNDNSSTTAAEGGSEITKMTPEEQAAFEKAAEEKLAVEKARADRAESVLKLTADERSHFDSLDTEGQDEFLAKSSPERAAVLKNAADANPVIFKSVDGTEYRQDDDARLVKMAQDRDADRKELLKQKAIAKRADLQKRAGEVLKNCPGTDGAKAELLGAVESIEDEAVRKGVLEILTAKDAGLAKAFENVGTSDDGNGAGADEEAGIMAIAKKLQESNPELTEEQAYSKALDTPEGTRLLTKMRS